MPLVHFAPLFIPLRRRLQTLAVCFFMFCFAIGHICSWIAIVFVGMIPFLSPLVVAYLVWIYAFDRRGTPYRGGRALSFLRRLRVWNYFRDYFPISLKRDVELNPEKNYVFCCHPHGVASVGVVCNFLSETNNFSRLFPGLTVRLLTLNMLFDVPLWREIVMAFGLCSVSKESCVTYLTSGPGRSVAIVIGGAAEALDARPNSYDMTLANRKGFVRVALMTGASLVPVFSFGENDIYEQWPNPRGSRLRKLQDKFTKKMGFSPPLVHGRGIFNYTFGILPHRRPIMTVVGQPIHVEKGEATSEEVDRIHALYLQRLQELFDRHKADFGIDAEQKLTFL